MTSAAPGRTPATTPGCTPPSSAPGDALVGAIGGVDTAALDCLQVNAAVVADALHGPGTHLRLGARLRFAPRTAAGASLPTVEPSPAEHIAALGEPLGLRLTAREPVDCGRELLAHLPQDGSPLYAVADAFAMPWLPYHGHQHMDHSLLLRAAGAGERVEVIDAYDNETPFGRADPVVCAFDREACAALFDGVRTLPVTVAPAPLSAWTAGDVLAWNAAHAREVLGSGAAARYASSFRDHGDPEEACAALLLETWLLNRSRRLHAGWAARSGTGPDHARRAAEQAAAWDVFAGQCYLAMRRVQRGRPVPPQIHDRLADLVTADAVLAAEAHAAPAAS